MAYPLRRPIERYLKRNSVSIPNHRVIFFPAVLFTVSVEVVLGGPWFVVAAVLSGWWQLFSGRGCILALDPAPVRRFISFSSLIHRREPL
ncbi:transmembrane protein, putative [Medicago truncatula]|uniref:Transmembrane protein, putative n=1 Tax=Medicago truncatula TaxID=3880 RepID=G7K2K4_MEDTR|nr:transmembrane protein, putative [Medicago truncatula]